MSWRCRSGTTSGRCPAPLRGCAPGSWTPERAFAAWRDRYRDRVEEAAGAFTQDGGGVQDLLDLTPPGIDELIAVSSLLDAVFGTEGAEPAYDLVVVDTAPTGHALRLLEMPELALSWDHYLLSLLLKYREAVGLGDLAAELVELSRSLKRLEALLRDPSRSRFVAVTRAAELPRRETVRLLRSLRALGIAVPAVVLNALPPAGCARCGASAGRRRRCAGSPGAGARPVRYHERACPVPAASRRRAARRVGQRLGKTYRMNEATYLYCLVRAPRNPLSAEVPPGLPGLTPPRVLAVGDGLWLIVAGAPLSEYGSAEIQRQLSDLSWVSDRALAHEAMIEHFAGAGAVLPMKLFTLFASDERAIANIRDHRERLEPRPRPGGGPGRVGGADPPGRRPRPRGARRRGARERGAELGHGLSAAQEAGAGRLPRARRPAPRRDGRRLRRARGGGCRGGPPRAGGLAGIRRPAAARRRLPGAGPGQRRRSRRSSSGAPRASRPGPATSP